MLGGLQKLGGGNSSCGLLEQPFSMVSQRPFFSPFSCKMMNPSAFGFRIVLC
jgi:hypothetical protein